MPGEDRTSLPAGLRGFWALLKLCRGWALVTTGLSDHCFGYKTEYKTKEAVGRASGRCGGCPDLLGGKDYSGVISIQLLGSCYCAGSRAASA